jgi:hypothetical protein
MTTCRRSLASGFLLLAALTGAPAGAQDFPPALTRWRADPPHPVFQGGGEPAWDRKIRERGWILRKDGLYHLFYTGYNDNRAPGRFLGHATSPDGVSWTRDPGNPLVGQGWVEDMCIVEHDNTFYMFAEGKGDIAHLLTSTDLATWTEQGPLDIRLASGQPISPGPRGTPFALVRDGTWYLFYERGDQGVWLATSRDARVWTNVQDDPVLPMGPDAYDRHAVAINQVFRQGDFYYALYHANASRPWKDWSTCLARSRDLVHWEKYPGNPVVASNRSSGIVVAEPDGSLRLFTMHPEVMRFSASQPVPAAPSPQPQR